MNAAVEIAKILLEHEIERQKKTVESATPGQQSDSTAKNRVTKATRRKHDATKPKLGQTGG